MGKIEQIKSAISDAATEQSKITEECFTIGGYTSSRIRHLMNSLGSISNNYLEIGVHRGSLFIATGYKNESLQLTAIDNWSELAEDGTVKDEFISNCTKFVNNWNFFETDCFAITGTPKEKYDLYLYDGNHGYESQKKGVTYFKDSCANEFILVVDDFSWAEVKKGTYDGIKEANLEILYEQVLWDGKEGGDWWNGIGVFLLKK